MVLSPSTAGEKPRHPLERNHEITHLRHARLRVPPRRLQPLPGRGRGGVQRRRLRRPRRRRPHAGDPGYRTVLDRRPCARQALRHRPPGAHQHGQQGRGACRGRDRTAHPARAQGVRAQSARPVRHPHRRSLRGRTEGRRRRQHAREGRQHHPRRRVLAPRQAGRQRARRAAAVHAGARPPGRRAGGGADRRPGTRHQARRGRRGHPGSVRHRGRRPLRRSLHPGADPRGAASHRTPTARFPFSPPAASPPDGRWRR